jgi:parallel beta-helix repeat protein
MHRLLGLGLTLVLTLSLVAVTGNTAVAASTRWVNDNNFGLYVPPGSSCNRPGYKTIQSAVNASSPGDTINVCPGSYPEQVVFYGTGKSNIRLRSVSIWQAIIRAPAVLIPGPVSNSIVRVDEAQDVQILGFTIMGPGRGICDTPTALEYGVKVQGGGSADIFGNHITHIRDDPVMPGCQSGTAIQVGRDFETTTGRARIIGNVVDDYGKNGITVDGINSYAEIAYNRVIGAGPTILTAQNGMQISREATANIRHNFVSSNDYSGSPLVAVATGILLYDSGLVAVDRNTANLNGVGIIDVVDLPVFTAGVGTAIRNNKARASTFDGIVLQDVSDRLVQTNKSSDNGGPGISLYGADQSTIKSNWVTSNKDTGILLDNGLTIGADDNSVRYNVVTYNGTTGPDTTDGIRINAPSTLNTIANNRLKKNVTHDCHDDSSGNTWTDNEGQTSNRTGLCEEDVDAERDCNDSDHGWDRNYKWNAEFGVPADMDFTAVYSTVNVDGLLAQLPSLPTSLGLRTASPGR